VTDCLYGLTMTKLVVVGGGKMGEALVCGLLASGWAVPQEVVVVEVSGARRGALTAPEGLARRFPGLQVTDKVPSGQVDGAIIAVKPSDVRTACRDVTSAGARRVLSVAAGVTLPQLESWCAPGTAVVRAMPNTAALVGASASAVAGGAQARPEDVAWAVEVMQSVGSVVEVKADLMDAVTGLSGSGPAYLFLVAEAMTEAGVLMGLARPVARQLVAQTFLGSARLLVETGERAEELRASVTSPGGTTAAGLRRLEACAARSAFIEAVAAATERSRELSPPAILQVDGP